MTIKLEPILLSNFSDGLITSGAVSSSQMPLTVVSESMNFDFDKIGSAKLRKGTTLLGDQKSGDILGLFEFRDAGAGTHNQIVAVNGTVAYYFSGGTWTSKRTGLTAGSKAEFTTFLDFIFMVNGVEATAIWDGNPANSFITTGNALNAPIGNYIENFRSRVWIANNTDRVWHSSLPSTANPPIITWNSTDWYIDISPQDGDNVTKLKRYKNALLLFKREHIYRIYSINETEPDPKISVGTYSGRSVVEAVDGIYFHHPSGIYRYNEGGISCISEPVIDFIQNITVANYSKITGWEDGNHIYFSIGNITLGNITYNNVVLRYTISSKVWTFRSYPTQFLVNSKYNDGTTIYNVCGDDNGNVLTFDNGITDNNNPIFYSLTTRPHTLDGLFSTRKHISKMAVIHNGMEGANVSYRVDNDHISNLKSLIQIENKIAKSFTTDIKGNQIWFNVKGSSIGESFTFGGIEILEATSETII